MSGTGCQVAVVSVTITLCVCDTRIGQLYRTKRQPECESCME